MLGWGFSGLGIWLENGKGKARFPLWLSESFFGILEITSPRPPSLAFPFSARDVMLTTERGHRVQQMVTPNPE